MIDTERDDRQFRRGVVLGLTMAEILLLLIFLLMLLLVAKLDQNANLQMALTQERDQAKADLAALQPLIDEIERKGGNKIDIMKDYVRKQRELDDANRALVEAKDATTLIEEAKRLSPATPTDEAIRKMVDAARVGDALAKAENDPEKLIQSAAACTAELQNCQGQTAFLNNRLNDKTGGRGMPPCWVNPQGKIEYIFDARLREDGIVLVDNKIAHRAQEQALLPIQNIRFNQPLEIGAFTMAVGELRKWSAKQEPECRFYVQLYDETGAGAKPRYKSLRRSVEDYFYIRIAD